MRRQKETEEEAVKRRQQMYGCNGKCCDKVINPETGEGQYFICGGIDTCDETRVGEFIGTVGGGTVYCPGADYAYSRSCSLDMVEYIGGKKMISEMVETRDRIQNEFYEEFENMSQKFIGKPIDASVLYTLERYMEAVAQRISAENGVHIISGKVRANISGTVMVEEPEIEMADGSTRKLSEWFDGL